MQNQTVNWNNQRGAALQLAIMATTIFALGAYMLQQIALTGQKVSNTYLANSVVESVEKTLAAAIMSRGSYFTSSEKQPQALPRACLLDYKDPSCPVLSDGSSSYSVPNRGGVFDLYNNSGKLVTGIYNEYGHNCSSSEFSSASVCDSNHFLISVSPVTYRIEAVDDRSKNRKDVFKISYTVENIKTKKIYSSFWLLKNNFTVENIYKDTQCPTDTYVTEILEGGDVVCEALPSYAGPRGLTGPPGPIGFTGSKGNRGPRGGINLTRATGCFVAETTIKMWDGSKKTIQNIRKGDEIYNPRTKLPSKVLGIFVGPEKNNVFHIKSGGFSVTVTESHPFKVLDLFGSTWSLKRADELKLSDLIETVNGYLPIDSISEISPPQEDVYNLFLEKMDDLDDHYLVADGIVAGEWV